MKLKSFADTAIPTAIVAGCEYPVEEDGGARLEFGNRGC